MAARHRAGPWRPAIEAGGTAPVVIRRSRPGAAANAGRRSQGRCTRWPHPRWGRSMRPAARAWAAA